MLSTLARAPVGAATLPAFVRLVAPGRRGLHAAASAMQAARPRRLPSAVHSVPLPAVARLLGRAGGRTHQGAVRLCSSGAGRAAQSEAALTPLERAQLMAPRVLAVAGGLIVVYGISKSVVYITSTFMHVSFSTMAWMGFFAGCATMAAVGGLAYSGYRWMTIRPELVYKGALAMIAQHPAAREALGDGIRSGTLRAYALRPGGFGLNSDRRLEFLAPRVQMLFQVQGMGRSAMATAEAEKQRGQIKYTLVTVDVMRTGGRSDLLLIEGSKERLKVRGQLRGFLQQERVPYIEQEVPDELTPEDAKARQAADEAAFAAQNFRD